MVDVIDTESSRRPMRPRTRAAIVALLIAGLVLAAVQTRHQGRHHRSTPATGSLTPAQYASAQQVVDAWTSQKRTHVSTAFAIVKPTKSPALASCPLVVTLVGRFAQEVPRSLYPHSRVSPAGTVLIARADPRSGRTCAGTYVHQSPQKPPGAADLVTAQVH